MANEIVIHVEADNDVTPGLVAAEAEAKAFGGKVESDLKASGDKAGKSMGNEVASGLNGLLRDLKLPEIDVKADAKEAEARLEEVRLQVKALASDDVSIEVKAKTNKALAEITKFKAEIADGTEAGEGFLKSFVTKIGGENPEVAAVIAGFAVAAAPVIGATISGAIIGGVGIGGVAGGFALAAKDPAVQAALTSMKTSIGGQLKDASKPFVDTAIKGVSQIGGAIKDIDFKQIFADSAQNAQPLIDGVTTAVKDLGHAITDVIHNAGPVLKEIGGEIGEIGGTLSHGLESLSDNSKQGASALHELFALINGSVDTVFMLVNGLTEVYGALDKISGGGPQKLMSEWGAATADVTGKSKEMAAAIVEGADKGTDAYHRETGALDAFSDALRASTDPLFAFEEAQTDVTTKQDAMNAAIKKHGENSKEAKAATREYEKAVINYVSAAVKASDGTGELTQQQKNMLASAGLSKKAIKNLETELHNAWLAAKKIDGFQVDISVNYAIKTFGGPRSSISPYDFHGLASGGVKGAASGAMSSGLTWTGEDGPELLDLPPGTAVHTKGDSARMASRGGSGPSRVVLSFDKSGLTGLASALMETLRAEIRGEGGNVQQVLGVAGA